MSFQQFLIGAVIIACSTCTLFAEPATLTKREVIELANNSAKKEGFDLRRFKPPELHYEYTRKNDKWFVVYEIKPGKNGNSPIGGDFFVLVHDKTREVRLERGR